VRIKFRRQTVLSCSVDAPKDVLGALWMLIRGVPCLVWSCAFLVLRLGGILDRMDDKPGSFSWLWCCSGASQCG
jgi:hypothetical protein